MWCNINDFVGMYLHVYLHACQSCVLCVHVCVCVCVCNQLATKIFIGKLSAMG